MKQTSKKQQIGILGAGKMGTAFLYFLVQNSKSNYLIHLYDSIPEQVNNWNKQSNVQVHRDIKTILGETYPLLICTKPNIVSTILQEIKNKRLVISIAAGISLSQMEKSRPISGPIIRAMPNVSIQVLQGYTVFSCNQHISQEEIKFATNLFSHAGLVRILDNEDLINAFTAISGSGPAYVFTFLQAMEDAAVLLGISRDIAREVAHATLYGAVTLSKTKMSEISPQELIHQVTSPGGTTIHGLEALQKHGFTTSIIEAVKAAYKTANKLFN